MKKSELAVGDSTELEIIFSTGKRVGKTSKRPTITTNEGPPSRRVTVKADIIRQPDSTYPIVINPYRIYVSKAGDTEVDEAKFTITNVSDIDLELEILSEPYGYFVLDIPKTIKAGEAIDCELKVNYMQLGHSFNKSITIGLNDPINSRFTIPIVRRLIGHQATANKTNKANKPKAQPQQDKKPGGK
ncbi:MAG: DUF1573 domain-containing protein [FCB group bacterium]|nr:DUF1573 domain-containing protein [FCB group bacterium]